MMRSSFTAAALSLSALIQADATTIWATKTVSVCPTQDVVSQNAGIGQTGIVDTTRKITETVYAHPSTVTVTVTEDKFTATKTILVESHVPSSTEYTGAVSNAPAQNIGAASTIVQSSSVKSVPYSFHNTTVVPGLYQNATGPVRFSTSTLASIRTLNATSSELPAVTPIVTHKATGSPVFSQNATISGYSTSAVLSCPAGKGNSTIHMTSTNNGAALAVVYITPLAATVYTTTTVTSTSTIPTKAGFLPIVDTTATVYPGANASDYPALTPDSGLTKRAIEEPASPCTSAVTIFAVQSGAATSTLSQQTVTSTSTSVVTVPYYAACGASNLINKDPVTGMQIDDVAPLANKYSNNNTYLYNWTNAYDCCAKCQEEETCAYSAFSPDLHDESGAKSNTCILTYWETCNVANNQEQWYARGINQYEYTVSNGNCGFMSRHRSPRCRYVYRDNQVQCDINCDGSYSQHLTYPEWEAAPALGECPLVPA
ncbi:hypothetical protein D6C87_04817 [Aureobasidium pullulans]|uniref:Apple domain-containing protein n=1 Tax=Aureobasidium pullulans TaxID=5580 RepID=A0AB38LJG9_AURPU|nr:hypothetical protein D6C94_09666 [Aureobasidium pullulans]THZ42720.1 hypothetical protein D6C87_04817 [Aureobasidium pullulans]THZ71011.1 hypothetical protein D6C88_07522 [Aureobasidium pullulans]